MFTLPEHHSERAHAILSASATYRWMNCPGSINLCEGLHVESSPLAKEGTAAHMLAELCLTTKNPAWFYINLTFDVEGEIIAVTDSMIYSVQYYVDYIGTLTQLYGVEPTIEKRFNLNWLVPDDLMFGTADCVFILEDKIVVIDFKHGEGIEVFADNNPQLMFYGLGAIGPKAGSYTKVELQIVQPRIRSKKLVKSWETDIGYLYAWAYMDLLPAAKRVLSGSKMLRVGDDQCQWCPAKQLGLCAEHAEKLVEVTDIDVRKPSSGELPLVSLMTDVEVLQASQYRGLMKKWFDCVDLRAKEILADGSSKNGFRLARGGCSPKWKDEAEVIRIAEPFAEIYAEKKLKSPSALKQDLISRGQGTGMIEDLIDENQWVKVVPENSNAPYLQVDALTAFADV